MLERYNTGPWGLEAGTRFEYVNIEPGNAAQARTFSALSLSGGINLKPSDQLSLSLSASRSIKVPDVSELYANGIHIGTRSFEIGNSDLEVETARSIDLSAHINHDFVDVTATLYNNRFLNYIYLLNTEEERDGFAVYRVSQGTAQFQGVEVEADIELLHDNVQHLAVLLWGDYTRATLTDDDQPFASYSPNANRGWAVL